METRGTKSRKENMSGGGHSNPRRNSMEWGGKQPDISTVILQELREFKKNFKLEIREEQKALRGEIREDMISQTETLSRKIDLINKDISEIKKEVKSTVKKTVDLEKKFMKLEKQQTYEEALIQIQEKRHRDKAIKIRGLEESENENLEERLLPPLAKFLDVSLEMLESQTDKIFRVSSKIAKEKGLPRDIVLCFTSTRLKERCIQRNYKENLVIQGSQISIFKDLSLQTIKQRQQYKPLTALLQKKNINYRWSNPEGITCWFNNKRIRVNSLEKAKEFQKNLLLQEQQEYDTDQEVSSEEGEISGKDLHSDTEREHSFDNLDPSKENPEGAFGKAKELGK
ncbi:uncharacterized protein LOC121932302 [Sceloporus undulatus]|uniref:uncharacterized protein LOC121932302 n=1 Tax=Sceloporus undulatus TaxID=8520 RepID=UPI001C4CFEA2|nr:uncharacterized protein LOC121932302 [Sceloporus undulatus]